MTQNSKLLPNAFDPSKNRLFQSERKIWLVLCISYLLNSFFECFRRHFSWSIERLAIVDRSPTGAVDINIFVIKADGHCFDHIRQGTVQEAHTCNETDHKSLITRKNRSIYRQSVVE